MSKHWSKLNRPTMSNLTLLESCNPSFYVFGHDNFMTSTWIEGGEWPSYRDTYSNYTLSSPTRHVLKPSPLAAETTSELITYVLNMDFTINTSCSLQVPYGVSTGATCVDIAFNLCRTRQFIVTLSTAVAIEVARNAKCTAITSIETCISKSPPDGIYSVSSGLFMHIMLSNMLHKSDMIILNSPNNMVVASSIVSHLLDKSQWHTIVITPNNMDTLPLRGTTRNALECAPEKDSHNLLGPSSVTSMNLNPNEYVGTISLPETPMRDARVRLDPIMQVDKLVYNTRKLLYEDVINLQLVVPNTRDRLREKSNHNNKISQCKLYYDILHLIIMMALGLHKGDITLARSLWRRNGFPTSSDAAALPLSLAPYRVRDKSDIRIGYDHSVAGDWLLARFKYPHNPDLYGKVQDSISSAASTQVKSVNGKFTIVLTVTQIRDYNADSYTSIVSTRALRIQPDQYGRVCYEECKMTRKPLSSILLLRAIWNEYRKMVKYRDTIYVDTIPFVDDRQIDFMSKEDARQVLACKLLPTYSEQEANSVLALWNDYAKRYKRIPISDLRYVNTFVNYFVDRERR